MSLIVSTIKNRIKTIVLNRPEKKNAFSSQLVSQLKQELTNSYTQENLRAIILTNSGDAFSAGADLSYIQEIRNNSFQENLQDSNSLKELFNLVVQGPLPIIAKVKGHALAGGCGLAAMCDFCFATPNSKFGFTETKIGFVPALVSVYLQHNIPQRVLREWLLSGSIFSAEEAEQKFLINKVIPSQNIDDFVDNFALNLIQSNSGNSIKLTKNLLNQISGLQLSKALDLAAETNAHARASSDCIQGVDAFLNKEKKIW